MVGEGLPMFWVTVLRNTGQLWEAVTDRDEVALRYLSDVKVTYTDKRAGLCEPQVCEYLILGLFCSLIDLFIGLF